MKDRKQPWGFARPIFCPFVNSRGGWGCSSLAKSPHPLFGVYFQGGTDASQGKPQFSLGNTCDLFPVTQKSLFINAFILCGLDFVRFFNYYLNMWYYILIGGSGLLCYQSGHSMSDFASVGAVPCEYRFINQYPASTDISNGIFRCGINIMYLFTSLGKQSRHWSIVDWLYTSTKQGMESPVPSSQFATTKAFYAEYPISSCSCTGSPTYQAVAIYNHNSIRTFYSSLQGHELQTKEKRTPLADIGHSTSHHF